MKCLFIIVVVMIAAFQSHGESKETMEVGFWIQEWFALMTLLASPTGCRSPTPRR
uniref:Uncharacterized protein n=1 Tax=Ackermannviridae sp. TaxID=2831612 RepID=A0A8S5VXQ7_9CAUD|nr:MAG TPA: hypothetical protein [Ackermannviridae sp.]